jgi:hypothetical protein
VNPSTGVFSWTPTEAQGPSTNVITVVVTDSGTPPMSSTQNFTVAVLESNEPPVLASIADRTIHAGVTLTITNSATDPDIPTNALTYSLSSGDPSASVDPTSGTFIWTPDGSFVGTTNSFTIIVTDYNPAAVNTQQLSDSKSFNIVVVPQPMLTNAVLSNDVLVISWTSISGQTYRVQYNTELGGTNWTDLPPDVTATDTTASQVDSNLSDAQRFYRVMVVP